MGSAGACSCRVVLALTQSSLYGWLLWQPVSVRDWCKKDYHTIDCHSPRNLPFASNTTSGLKVVMPSYGQTGTTSLIMALRELGYRAYHADDFSVFAKPVMFDTLTPRFFAETVSRCRMDAISLEPVTDVLPWVAKTSPDAKFVLTWRSFPSWLKSTTAFQKRDKIMGPVSRLLIKANDVLPWVETWDWLFGTIKRVRLEGDPFSGRFAAAAYLYRQLCNSYMWPVNRVKDRGTYKGKGGEEAYLAHINEIRTTIRPERLLELDVSHQGWAELEHFLGLPSKRSGRPFPRPRSSKMRTNEPILERQFGIASWALLVLVMLHCLNYTLLALALHGVGALVWRWWHRGRRRWVAALARAPVIAVLDGLDTANVLLAGEALVKAGVRVIVLDLSSPAALESIRLLVQALPPDVLVGALMLRTELGDVHALHSAGASLIATHCADGSTLQWAKALGLVALAGVCTPSEALSALAAGADALVATTEHVPTARLHQFRSVLPDASIVLLGAAEPAVGRAEALRAARVDAIGVTICSLADATADVADRARQLLGR